MTVKGIDVSAIGQGSNIDWQKVAASGIEFAFVKATQGVGFVDPAYLRNKAEAEMHGILVSPYHFYQHDENPAAQAAHFIKMVGRLPKGVLQPAVDIEMPGDGAGKMNYDHARAIKYIDILLSAIKAGTGRDPIIYTYPGAWQGVTGGTDKWSGVYPFWVASYRSGAPTLPPGVKVWTFWQTTSTGHVPGVVDEQGRPKIVDLDVFFSTSDKLKLYAEL